MMVLCYHKGALGHTVSALIECCTSEGGVKFPSFNKKQHLHHYINSTGLFQVKHPDCDVSKEQQQGNFVISASSRSLRGRLLIKLMGLQKCYDAMPDVNKPVIYKQDGNTYGEQLEILSITLLDEIKSDNNWFMDADCIIDILDFWDNYNEVCCFLKKCGFQPNETLVEQFCQKVKETNQTYYDNIDLCFELVDKVIHNKNIDINLTFYDTAMIHALLLNHFKIPHYEVKLLKSAPRSTQDFIDIFKDYNHGN